MYGTGDTVKVDCTHWVVVGASGVVIEALSEIGDVDASRVALSEASCEGAKGTTTIEEDMVVIATVVLDGTDGDGSDGEGKVLMEVSFVMVTATAVAGSDSDSSTIFVDTMISVEGGRVLGGAVIVVMSFVVCITV